jgi:hypothetical protein
VTDDAADDAAGPGRVTAAAEIAAARVRVPAAATVMTRERFVDMNLLDLNEGRGKYRAKTNLQ